jgi:Aminotransferase class I and II
MSVRRLEQIPGFHIDRVAAAAGDDPDVLRLENLDTDIPPPAAAMEATRAAIGEDDANSWLPFTGRDDLKQAVAAYIERRGGPRYDGRREIVITSGEGDAMLDALFCLTDPGDEVILTDPTYAGMLNRVRLVGAVPRLVPLHVADGEWRLDLDALQGAVTDRTRVVFLNNASFPSGWVASDQEWEAVGLICRERDVWLLYWGGFEGVLFDGRPVRHPAALPGMRDRTVIVGAPSLEQRMIAWRVGWVVAPGELVDDVSRVQIYNGLVPSGSPRSARALPSACPMRTLPPRTLRCSGGATRRSASSTASPSCGRPEPGRCCSTSPPSGWTVSRSPTVCSGRSRRHPDAWLGRRDRRSSRPLRVQQRARRAAGAAGEAGPRGACGPRRSNLSVPLESGARWSGRCQRSPTCSRRDVASCRICAQRRCSATRAWTSCSAPRSWSSMRTISRSAPSRSGAGST